MTTKDKKTIEEQVKDKEEELLSEMLDEDPVVEDEVGDTEQELEEEPEITIADIFSGFCKTEEEEECDEEEQDECKTCCPDPSAYVPNWRYAREPFLNKKTCDYTVTVFTDYEDTQASDDVLSAIKLQAIQKGAARLIHYYKKTHDYVGPIESEVSPCEPETPPRLGGCTWSSDAREESTFAPATSDSESGILKLDPDSLELYTPSDSGPAASEDGTVTDTPDTATDDEGATESADETESEVTEVVYEEGYSMVESDGSRLFWSAEEGAWITEEDYYNGPSLYPGEASDWVYTNPSGDYYLLAENGEYYSYVENVAFRDVEGMRHGVESGFIARLNSDIQIAFQIALDLGVPESLELFMGERFESILYDATEEVAYKFMKGEHPTTFAMDEEDTPTTPSYDEAEAAEEDTELSSADTDIDSDEYSDDDEGDMYDPAETTGEESADETSAFAPAGTALDPIDMSSGWAAAIKTSDTWAYLCGNSAEWQSPNLDAHLNPNTIELQNAELTESLEDISVVEEDGVTYYNSAEFGSGHIKAKSWHVSQSTRIRVEITISADVFDNIPAAEKTDSYLPIADFESALTSGAWKVSLMSETINSQINRVRWILKHYATKRMPMAYAKDDTVLGETFNGMTEGEWNQSQKDYWNNLGLSGEQKAIILDSVMSGKELMKQRGNLDKFVSNILDFLNLNMSHVESGGYPVRSFWREYTRLTGGIESLDLEFDSSLRIKSVKVNRKGCPPFTLVSSQDAAAIEYNRKRVKALVALEGFIKEEETTVEEEMSNNYNISNYFYEVWQSQSDGAEPLGKFPSIEGYDSAAAWLQAQIDAIDTDDRKAAYANPYANPEVFAANGWEEFAYSFPCTDPRTMGYIASLPYMDEALQADTPLAWNDFMTLYTYPKLEVRNFNEMRDNDPPCNSVSNALENMLGEGVDIFMEILLSSFDRELCRMWDAESDDREKRFGETWSNYRGMGTEIKNAGMAAWQQIAANDPFLSEVIGHIERTGSIDGIWGHLMDRLGRCGWMELLASWLHCFMAGMSYEDILAAVIEKVLSSLDFEALGRLLLIGLSKAQQDEIMNMVSESLPEEMAALRPWADFEPSTRDPENIKYDAAYAAARSGTSTIEQGDDGIAITTGVTADAGNVMDTDTARAFANTYSEGATVDDLTASESETYAARQSTYLSSSDATRTLGSVLLTDDVQNQIKDAYTEALMEMLTPEEILESLTSVGGVPLAFLAELGDAFGCPNFSIFDPPLATWFTEALEALSEWDFPWWCKSVEKFSWPPEISLKWPPLTWDMILEFINILLAALEEAMREALKYLIVKVIQLVFDMLCKLAGSIGAAALNAVGLMEDAEYMDWLKENLCGSNATDSDLANALSTAMSAMGLTNDNMTADELAAVGAQTKDALSGHQTNAKVVTTLNLMSGQATEEEITDTTDYFASLGNAVGDALSNRQNCANFFSTIGQGFVGQDRINDLRDSYIEKMKCKEGIGICSMGEFTEHQQDLAKSLMNTKMLTMEQVQQIMIDETEQKMDEFNNVFDAFMGGGIPTSGTGDVLGECGLSVDSLYGSASCDGVLTLKDDPATIAATRKMAADMFAVAEIKYEDDLIGLGGIFDRILSDKDGRSKRIHDLDLENLLKDGIGDNPKTVGKYLRDIIRGDRSEYFYGENKNKSHDTKSFKYSKFNLSKGISSHTFANANSKTICFTDNDDRNIKQYHWKFNRVYLNEYIYGYQYHADPSAYKTDDESGWAMVKYQEFLDQKIDGNSTTQQQIFDAAQAQGMNVNAATGVNGSDNYKAFSIYRKWRYSPKGTIDYPNPTCVMTYHGSDPSHGRNSDEQQGQPHYVFHYWHDERFARENEGKTWSSAEDELKRDTCRLHIFQVLPEEDWGKPEVGEYTADHALIGNNSSGNAISIGNGFGPRGDTDRAATAINPVIRMVSDIPSGTLEQVEQIDITGFVSESDVWSSGDRYFQKPVTFAKHVRNVLEEAMQVSESTDYDSLLNNMFEVLTLEEYEFISNSFLEQYSKQVASNDDVWASGLFNFNYQELHLEASDAEDAGETDSVESLGILDKDDDPMKNWRWTRNNYGNDRGTGWYRPEVADDTKAISENVALPEDEYGVAAYYIHNQYQYGWARLADEFLPGPANPCDEQINSDLFGFKNLESYWSDRYSKLEDDERVQYNPSCTWDPPYDRINNRSNKATIEAVIKATMRITIWEYVIKGMTAFGKFDASAGVFGELLPGFMFLHFRQNLHEYSKSFFGRINKGHKKYDHAFLEQCVCMYARGMANGTYPFEQVVVDAIDKIDEKINLYYSQPQKDPFYAKRKAYRRRVWEQTEEEATLIAMKLFRAEFEETMKTLSGWVCGDEELIDDLQLHFLNGNMTLDSQITSVVTTDVVSNMEESRFTELTEQESGLDNVTLEVRKYRPEFEYVKTGGFLLEKYIIVQDKDDVLEEVERAEHLYGVVNLNDWKEYLIEKGWDAEDSTVTIGDYFESWKFGYRLVYVPSTDSGDGMLRDMENYEKISKEHSLLNKSFRLEPSDVELARISAEVGTGESTRTDVFSFYDESNLQRSVQGQLDVYTGMLGMESLGNVVDVDIESVPLIPLASVNVDIPAEMKINSFDVVEDYDLDCMTKIMREDPLFKAIFEYSFSLDKYLSLPTIYIMQCFLDSIGMDDSWYQEGNDKDSGVDYPDPWDGGWWGKMHRSLQHSQGPGLKTGDWWKSFLQPRQVSYRNWDKICFKETRQHLTDMFIGAYDYKKRGGWSLPNFKLNFKLNLKIPPFGLFWQPKWRMNKRLIGPDCEEDERGSAAERAAYNSS